MTQPEQTLYSRFQPAARMLAIVMPKQGAAVSGEVDDFCFGSWPCKNTLPREVGERPGPVRSQATIAAISGLVPTMFMTRVRL